MGPYIQSADFFKSIMDRFVTTGNSQTVKDLSVALGFSEAVIRNAIRRLFEDSQFMSRITIERVDRPRYSKSYPDMIAGSQVVDAYRPSISALRAEIIRLRASEKSTSA